MTADARCRGALAHAASGLRAGPRIRAPTRTVAHASSQAATSRQIPRLGRRRCQRADKEIVKLARIRQPADVDRWAGVDELPDDRVRSRSQNLECPGEDRDDLVHALLMREARFEAKQPAVDAMERRIEGSSRLVAEYGGAARQIVEQANLPIQQPLRGHGLPRIASGRAARECARRRRGFHRRRRAARRAREMIAAGCWRASMWSRRSSAASGTGWEWESARTGRSRKSSRTVMPPAMWTSCTMPGRQGVEKLIRIEAVIAGIQVEVLDVEQKSGAGLAADQVEKLGIRQLRIRPFEHVGDVLQQEGNGNARLDGAHFRDDRLGDRLGLRQRQEVGEVAARHAREREVLAVGGRLEALDDRRDLDRDRQGRAAHRCRSKARSRARSAESGRPDRRSPSRSGRLAVQMQ